MILDQATQTIDAARAALQSMLPTAGSTNLPSTLCVLLRAHLVRAATTTARQVASAELVRASDLSEVLLSLGGKRGYGTELFIDEDYKQSFVPRVTGPHAWSDVIGWIDAFDLATLANRTENFDALASHFALIVNPQEHPALTAYATLLARVASHDSSAHDGTHIWMQKSRQQLHSADEAVMRWLTPRLDAWAAFGRNDASALATALVAIADAGDLQPNAQTASLDVNVAASAMHAFAHRNGMRIELSDRRVQWLPPRD